MRLKAKLVWNSLLGQRGYVLAVAASLAVGLVPAIAVATAEGPILDAPRIEDFEAQGSASLDSKDSPNGYTAGEIQPRIGGESADSATGSSRSDGWTAKGQASGRRVSKAASIRPGESVSDTRPGLSPPAMLVTPQRSAPISNSLTTGQGVLQPPGSSPQNLPYPYGTPAPVPPIQNQPRKFLGISLPRLFKNEQPAGSSSLSRWWSSLWNNGRSTGAPPVGTPQWTNPQPGPGLAGTGTVWSPGVVVMPSKPEQTQGRASAGTTPLPQATSAYVVPYAVPPSAVSSTLVPPPLAASSPQNAVSPGGQGTISTAISGYSGGLRVAPPERTPGPPGMPASPETAGWTTAQGGTSIGLETANSTMMSPGSPSGTGTPPAGVGGSVTAGMPARSGFVTPGMGPQTSQPSLLQRLKDWWADVTAPRGIDGRWALLPSAPSSGVFRPAPPASDPFSQRAAPPSSGWPVSPGVSPGGSPAVLPPPPPQLPLRQAW